MKCPYCSTTQGRCATTSSGRYITECISCGRVVEERQTQSHHLFHTRAQDTPLYLVTPDLPTLPDQTEEDDPFEPTGFITAFSTWSLEPYPVFAQSSVSYSGYLAELERVLETTSSSSASGPSVVVDNLRAYLQIIDVASILGLDCDISDHAFQLFRDCSSATCLRNRSVEALATAALVQAIREAQEPRTLQEISLAANLPQKEIGKYIKILGEALQLSQPLNSNSISVHMPRFCTLLQLNKSAQDLATHIGEVVINKCFCTRRNPISISAAAIYLASQLEDKRKTQAEICKVTGLTEVTLRKVYKELLENWDDLLPSNYTPAIPPEKAFPTDTIASGRSSSTPRIIDGVEAEIKPVESRDDITNDHPWKFPSQNTKEMDVDGGVTSCSGSTNGGVGNGNTRLWPLPVSSSQANARSMQKTEVVSANMNPARNIRDADVLDAQSIIQEYLDKLPAAEFKRVSKLSTAELFSRCDRHMAGLVQGTMEVHRDLGFSDLDFLIGLNDQQIVEEYVHKLLPASEAERLSKLSIAKLCSEYDTHLAGLIQSIRDVCKHAVFARQSAHSEFQGRDMESKKTGPCTNHCSLG